MDLSKLTFLFPAAVILGLVLFTAYYLRARAPRLGTTEWIDRAVRRPRFRFEFTLHPMGKRDALPLAVLLVVFLVADFWGLGGFTNPQTFYQFSDIGTPAVLSLPQTEHVSKIMYYTGLYTGHYRLEFSADGEIWAEAPSADESRHPTAMPQTHADLFKWIYADMPEGGFDARYLRITAVSAPLELGELVLYDVWGDRIPMTADGRLALLFDETDVIPDAPSYMNSMYFDEIYHGRTAYETLRHIYPYETVHPPLGKTIIALGVELFGMTPFGWRVMGTLFGVLMLAALYVLLKNMFGKTSVAVCGTLLLGFDFMHFTQTRIATVDTYGVFFIILSYLFMYRFIAQEHSRQLRKAMRPLALSGLFFGLGAASKWIMLYAAMGLAALYILRLVTDYSYYYETSAKPGEYSRRLLATLGFSVLFFIVVPGIIYVLAYIPFGVGRGMSVRGGMLWDKGYYKLIYDVNAGMFNYHKNLVAEHPYSSTWAQWLVDARPILYYRDTSMGGGLKSAFAAFGNPIVWWGGLVAMLTMLYLAIFERDRRALVILIGYFAQLAPWLFITRVVFVYHYFPSVIFLILAICHTFDTVLERAYFHAKRWVYGYTAAAGVLFALFYPSISGLAVPETYTRYVLRWFNSWPL
ncbi:MAG: phospholipid carrier-dependent glycosyltransferase [Oscillospiraceae bacterium]|nr:phospholipid carrier-dependent glycosyltransferase [Oscillospiraceae bacterium]